MHRNTQK